VSISGIAFDGAGSVWLTLRQMQRLPGGAGGLVKRRERLARV